MKFDLALTVCAMRYISDLHIGKVNPKHFAFALDEESKRYDLAEFLRDHVVDASRRCRRAGASGAAVSRLSPYDSGPADVHGAGEKG